MCVENFRRLSTVTPKSETCTTCCKSHAFITYDCGDVSLLAPIVMKQHFVQEIGSCHSMAHLVSLFNWSCRSDAEYGNIIVTFEYNFTSSAYKWVLINLQVMNALYKCNNGVGYIRHQISSYLPHDDCRETYKLIYYTCLLPRCRCLCQSGYFPTSAQNTPDTPNRTGCLVLSVSWYASARSLPHVLWHQLLHASHWNASCWLVTRQMHLGHVSLCIGNSISDADHLPRCCVWVYIGLVGCWRWSLSGARKQLIRRRLRVDFLSAYWSRRLMHRNRPRPTRSLVAIQQRANTQWQNVYCICSRRTTSDFSNSLLLIFLPVTAEMLLISADCYAQRHFYLTYL